MPLIAFLLLAFALLVIQTFIGGAKLVYGLPAYSFFGLAGLALLIPLRRRRRSGSPSQTMIAPRMICVWSALGFAAWVCARAWLSPVPYLARTDFFTMLTALMVYLTAAVYMTDPRWRTGLLWVLFAFATVQILVGCVQFAEGNNFMLLPWLLRPDYGRRASGFYICPNHLAGLLEMLGLMALAFFFWGRSKLWVRVVAGYVVASCLAGVAITQSRGGYLSTIAGFLAFAAISLAMVRKLKRREFVPYLAAAVLGLLVFVGGVSLVMSQSDALKHRMGQVYDPQNMRVLLWQAGLKQFALQPITGTGGGTYLYHGREFRSEQVQADPIHVHNDYIELLAEYGAIGLALFGVFMGAHLYSGYRGIRRIYRMKLKVMRRWTSNELALCIGALSALAALAVHSLMDFNLHIPANTAFVALLFGILANPTTAGGKTEVRPSPPTWLRFSAPALGLALLLLAAPHISAEYHGERARMALRDKQFPEAADWAQHALAREEKCPDLYFYLGEAKHHLGMLSEDPMTRKQLHQSAVEAFRKGLEIFPQDLRLLLKIGRTLDLLGRYDEAETYYERALKADPNFGNVYAYYGLHWHVRGDLKRAAEFYAKAQKLGESEISAIGLQDLERDRKVVASEPHPLSDFVTTDDERDADPAESPDASKAPVPRADAE